MRARVVRALDTTDADVAAWSALSARALEPNPFSEPECVLAAARHQENGDRIELLFAMDGDTLHGCIPFTSEAKWHWAPRSVATSKVRRMIYLGTPLLDRDRAHEACAAMFEHMTERRRASGDQMLVLEWVGSEGGVARTLKSAAAALRLPMLISEEFDRPAIVRPPTDPADRPVPPVRRRQTTRAQRRKLMAEFGGEVRMVERSNEPHALKELIDLESQGYKGRQQIAVATQPGEAEYFEEMCTQFAEDGRLVLTALAAGDRFIAYSSCFLAGDQIFLGKVTYDESFSSFSPGNQLQYDTIDYFGARHDFRLLDSCTYPGNKTFTGIYPDRRGIATFIIGLGSPVERMLLRAMPTARRLRSALRSAD